MSKSTVRKLQVAEKNRFTRADMESFFGKKMPHSLELEEVVVGAILISKTAYPIVKDILEKKTFYHEKHALIYEAAAELHERGIPIDLLTAAEQLKKTGKLDDVGGAAGMVAITNKVASSANIEYHARIIYEKYLKRDGIAKTFNKMYAMYEDRTDVFDLRNNLADDLRVQAPGAFLKVSNFNDAIEQGASMPEQKMLCGTLLYQFQVAFLFGPPGTGKSIFAIQMADAMSKGMDTIPNILTNECEPQRVLYIDFELTNRNIWKRYNGYKFHDENLMRASVDDDFSDYDKRIDQIAQQQIERQIIHEKPTVLIIDNITYLTAESSQDTNIAMQLMKRLVGYKKKYDLTMLVVAHTSKKYSKYSEFEQGDMAGSANLPNFADAQFGIRTSAQDSRMKYIKQFKTRDSEETYGAENVIVCETTTTSKNYSSNFLCFDWLRCEPERSHLAMPESEENMQDLIEVACNIMAKDPLKKGYGTVMEEIGWTRTRNTLRSKMQKYAENNPQTFIIDGGKVKYPPTNNPF